MAGKLKWPHMILARFTVEQFDRMVELCKSSEESAAAFIREAVANEIDRRSKSKGRERAKTKE
jgi:hypothetical protein